MIEAKSENISSEKKLRKKKSKTSELGASLVVALVSVASMSALTALQQSVNDRLCSPATVFDEGIFGYIQDEVENNSASFSDFGAKYIPGDGCCLTEGGTPNTGFCVTT